MKRTISLNLKARYFNVLADRRVGLVLQDVDRSWLRFGVVYDLTLSEDRKIVKKLIEEIEGEITSFPFDVTTEEKNIKFQAAPLGKMDFFFTPEDVNRAMSS